MLRQRPTSRPLAAALVVVLALLAGACGGDPEPSATVSSADPAGGATEPTDAPPPTGDEPSTDDQSPTGLGNESEACDLLTADDAVEILGEEVEPGTQSTDECWWDTPDGLRHVRVIRGLYDDPATWRLDHQDEEPLPELEGEAYFSPILGTTEFVFDGEVYLVGQELRGEGDVRATSLALAQLVEGRL